MFQINSYQTQTGHTPHTVALGLSKCCFLKWKVVADVTPCLPCLSMEARGEQQSQTWLEAKGEALPLNTYRRACRPRRDSHGVQRIKHVFLLWRNSGVIWHNLGARLICSWIALFLWRFDRMNGIDLLPLPRLHIVGCPFLTVSQRQLLI